MIRRTQVNYEAPTRELYPSIFYKFPGKYDDPGYVNKLGLIPSPWDGKKIIEVRPFQTPKYYTPRDVVYEVDIAQFASPYFYRFVCIYDNGSISQIDTRYRPERLNVFFKYNNDVKNWLIAGMAYF